MTILVSLCLLLLLVILLTCRAWQPYHRVQMIRLNKMRLSSEQPSILDQQLSVGYAGTGEDWSYAPSSTRSDRPLDNQQLRKFTTKSNRAGLIQLLSQIGEIAAAAWLISFAEGLRGVPGLILGMIGTAIMGFGLVTMGHCAQHECIHNTAFKSRRLNVIVSWLVSLPRLTNPRWERMLHKGINIIVVHCTLPCSHHPSPTAITYLHHIYHRPSYLHQRSSS